MTKKQYKLRFCAVDGNLISAIEDEDKIYTLKEIIDILNQSKEKNKQLKKEKERYKLLSEIREEEINNRILTIKEFISNCSDDIVKNELENLFYSEVKEYDLAKENRKLKRENEQLKKDVELWKQVASHYINELNVFEHCKKYKTECKDIYWSSD